MAPPPPSMSCRIAALFLKILAGYNCVLGMADTLLQIAFTLFSISTGNRIISGDGSFTFDFYGDKVTSYQLATGSAAAFAVTKELKRSEPIEGVEDSIDKFLNKGYACASLVLIGFVCVRKLVGEADAQLS
ncbi:hypothetical protein WN943_018347 [Citrus x changshan-huyou]